MGIIQLRLPQLQTKDEEQFFFFACFFFPRGFSATILHFFLIVNNNLGYLDKKLLFVSPFDWLKTIQNIIIIRACQTPSAVENPVPPLHGREVISSANKLRQKSNSDKLI